MISRHITHAVNVGGCWIGGENPVLVQSMTDTPTANIDSTVSQIKELHAAGSEIVRITVNDEESARAVPYIHEKILKSNLHIPLAGCFHYNGHTLLNKVPECAEALAKYRINPGNVGFGNKRDSNFETMIELALKYNKPVRIGVNWGSLDKDLSTSMMNDNNKLSTPLPAEAVMKEALLQSTLISAEKAKNIGMAENQIILSCKVSRVNDLVDVYQQLAQRSKYALHLGLTEAGMGREGIVRTTSALAILLHQGIGDTIRASLTQAPGVNRVEEVKTCRDILQSLAIRSFTPQVTSCPGCGRTTSSYFRKLSYDINQYIQSQMTVWSRTYPEVANMNVAVMGCIVNGPGESKHADIGISLPGTGEDPVAPVFIDGKKSTTLRGDNIASEFQDILVNYVRNRYTK